MPTAGMRPRPNRTLHPKRSSSSSGLTPAGIPSRGHPGYGGAKSGWRPGWASRTLASRTLSRTEQWNSLISPPAVTAATRRADVQATRHRRRAVTARFPLVRGDGQQRTHDGSAHGAVQRTGIGDAPRGPAADLPTRDAGQFTIVEVLFLSLVVAAGRGARLLPRTPFPHSRAELPGQLHSRGVLRDLFGFEETRLGHIVAVLDRFGLRNHGEHLVHRGGGRQ